VVQTTRSIRALLVGDEEKKTTVTGNTLLEIDGNLEIATATTETVLTKPLRNGEYDCIVLCEGASLSLFTKSMKRMMGMPFIVYSADTTSESLLQVFRMGVTAYIVDDGGAHGLEELVGKIRSSVEAWRDSIRDAVALRILNAVNKAETPKASVEAVLKILKGYTDAQALAIRLRSKGDYPYYATIGFPRTMSPSSPAC